MSSSSQTADLASILVDKTGPTPKDMLPDFGATTSPKKKSYNVQDVVRYIKKNHGLAMNEFSKVIKKQDQTIKEVKKVQESQKIMRQERNRKYQDKLKIKRVDTLNTITELQKKVKQLTDTLRKERTNQTEKEKKQKKLEEERKRLDAGAVAGGEEGCSLCHELVKRLRKEIDEQRMTALKAILDKELMQQRWLEDCNLMTDATLFGDNNDGDGKSSGDAEVIDDDENDEDYNEDEEIDDEEDDDDEADEMVADYTETAQTA